MKVCIAEKPSVAEIASVLGANTKHDGYFEGNGIR
jgi:DNA topoisomerase-3